MANDAKYSAQRDAGREHIPIYPKGFIAIRIVQLVLAVVILGLCAYSLSMMSFSGNCLNLFTAIACIIISIYHLVAEFGPAKAYNYWAILGLDIFMVVFWLVSFALLASQVAPFMNGVTTCDWYGDCVTTSLTGTYLTIASCMAAASALGGVEFVLFIISLAIHSVKMHQHRQAGLHCNPVTEGVAPAGGPVSNGASSVEKTQVQPVYSALPQQNSVPAVAYVQQQQQQPATYPLQTMTPTPPPQQAYNPPPVAQPVPYYPQQQQQQQAVNPLVAQHTGGTYTQVQPEQGTQAVYQQYQ